MSTSAASTAATGSLNPLGWRQAWLSVDSNPRAIAFTRGVAGQIAVYGAFVAVLAVAGNLSTAALVLVAATLLIIMAAPAWRMHAICGASVFYLAMRPFRIDAWMDLAIAKAALLPVGYSAQVLQIGAVGLYLIFAFAFLQILARNPTTTIARRPVLSLIVGYFILLAAAAMLPESSGMSAWLWTFCGVFVSSIWFLAYAAADQKLKNPAPVTARAAFQRPFWGGSATPIGKGFGYLAKFDAKDGEELAVTRLKALKLAVWAALLTILWQASDMLLAKQAGIPPLNDVILAHAAGRPFADAVNWVSLVSNYFVDLVVIAVWGHTIVAIIRMCGFRIPRNTRNPLAARSLADFWNRYFFYFKELLVDFFFYPSFIRTFKKAPKLRIAAATFCAAGLGNFLYHFMRETYVFAALPWAEALAVFQNAAFYSLALAVGLIVSQLRKRKPQPADGFWRYDVLPRLNVIAFFCFLKIFDDITGIGTLGERFAFTFSLFNPWSSA